MMTTQQISISCRQLQLLLEKMSKAADEDPFREEHIPSSIARPGPIVQGKEGQAWAGDPKEGQQSIGGDTSLEYLRKALMLAGMHGSGIKQQLERGKGEFLKEGKELSENTQVARGNLGRHLKDFYNLNHQIPLQSIMGSWIHGFSTHDEFVEGMSEYRGRVLDDLKGQIPDDAFDELSKRFQTEQETYAEKIAAHAAGSKSIGKTGDAKNPPVSLSSDSDKTEEELPFGQRRNKGWNVKENENEMEYIINNFIPYEQNEDGSIKDKEIHEDIRSQMGHVMNSDYGRKAMRKAGYGWAIELFDRAMNPNHRVVNKSGNPVKRENIAKFHNELSGSKESFSPLLSAGVEGRNYNPAMQQFTEGLKIKPSFML